MAADPILFLAGRWLGIASGVLVLLTIIGFVARWGIRFRLVGVTSFTVLLSISCLAFAISYSPRVSVPGAVQVPVVFDNGSNLVIAAAPDGLEAASIAPTLEEVALNLRRSGRTSANGHVTVRLRRIEPVEAGLGRPVVLAETSRDRTSAGPSSTP